ncbi:unnamed protein product [Calicophoron daubneyi]|uniref:Rap guanine nucleotide exchange factor 2 n=1 Tax=Calicophoron daubneyi TaxID=300641 RepID=A0AAV2T706_CALDB
MDAEDAVVIRLLSIEPQSRSAVDNATIYAFLRTIEGICARGSTLAHREAELREICQIAQHRRVPGDILLYRTGEVCDSWFILLTGSVLIESSMFLPRSCFGMRINGSCFRPNDCLVLEPSDLVVINYPMKDRVPVPVNGYHEAIANHGRKLSFSSRSEATSSIISAGSSSSGLGQSGSTRMSIPSNRYHSQLSSPSSLTSSPEHQFGCHGYLSSGDTGMVVTGPQRALLRNSQLSDTSSAHSIGSSTSTSGVGRESSCLPSINLTSSEKGPTDSTKAGVVGPKLGGDSSILDSDEEEDEEEEFESSSHESLRDSFWESMLKEPSERTEEDIQILLENVQQLPAFSNLTKATCRALCAVMVLAVVREAGQIVLTEDEKLDTWSVVLNGTVEVVEPDGTIRELTRGDAFGVRPNKEDRIHRGVMRTVTEDCQFACVPQADYLQIMSREGEAEIPEMGEGGRVVLVYESVESDTSTVRPSSTTKPPAIDSTLYRKGHVVTKGTPEKLIEHLIADLSNVDVTYPEDFLLTYRTFLDTPRPIVDRLLSWHMHNPKLRARVNRIILLWVHNHFNDFEDSPEMMKFVEKFDAMLAADGTAGERRLFQLACSTKARPRQIDLELVVKQVSSPSKPLPSSVSHSNGSVHSVQLPFTFFGGQDGFGIFVHQVDPRFASALETNSWNPSGRSGDPSPTPSSNIPGIPIQRRPQIRRGDQLLAVNSRSVEHLSPSELIHLIDALSSAASTDLSGSVGSNSSASAPSSELSTHPKPSTTATCHIRFTLVYNPVQYHQLVNSLRTKTSDQANSVGTAQVSDGIPKIISTNRVNPSANNHGASPFHRASSPADPGRSLTPAKANASHLDCPRISNDQEASRSHSAHTSPTRSPSKKDKSKQHVLEQTGPELKNSETPEKQFHLLTVSQNGRPHRSSSQPDLSLLSPNSVDISGALSGVFGRMYASDTSCFSSADVVWSAIRVWRSSDSGRDQSSKLVLLPSRQTNALEATRLALEEFGLNDDEVGSYCLCHVTVEPGPVVKQSRLANNIDDLAGRLTLNARYYLKHNRSHDALVAEDVAKSILAESRVTFMQLSPDDLAVRLTLDDYEVFRAVQSTEYIDEVFGLTASSDTAVSADLPAQGYATGHDNLDRFSDLVNREAYWAPTEICNETNLNRRVDLLKRFIKLTKLCRDLRNFNTMFCLLVGLHQTPVERLKQTWERLPNKYQKMYRDLSMVLDTSRNFLHYRNLLTADNASAPMLPYLPLVLKDLTFIHLGNPSHTADGLINFVKLRMLAKEVRAVCRMCNVDYDATSAQRLLRGTAVGGRGRTWNVVKNSANVASKPVGAAFAWESAGLNASLEENKKGAAEEEQSRRQSVRSSITSSNSKRPNQSSSASNHSTSPGLMLTATGNTAATPLLSSFPNAASMWNRRRSGGINSGASSVNPKKIYEAWLVTLRIRTYLANLCVNQDPDSLSQWSAKLEPGSKDSRSASISSGSPGGPVGTPELSSSSSSPLTVKEPKSPSKSPISSASSWGKSSPLTVHTATSSQASTTSVSTPSSATSTTSTSAAPLSRPILGAQSVEDARKLLALSECHKRSHHRVPAFTFPNHSSAQLIFVTPPPVTQAGVGFGHLQYHQQTTWPNSYSSNQSSAVVVSHSSQPSFVAYQNIRHPQQPCYTIVGTKSLLLDSLIPMPQRIGSASAVQNSSVRAVMSGQGVQRPQIHHHHAVQSQRVQQTKNDARVRMGQAGRSSVDRGTGPSVAHTNMSYPYPQVTQGLQQHQSSHPTTGPSPSAINNMTPQNPPLQAQHQQRMLTTQPGCASPSGAHQNKMVPVSMRPYPLRVNTTAEETYHYPTANMTPLGVPMAIQRYRQSATHRMNQQFIDLKPTRPPPYELALALRQSQNPHPQLQSHSRQSPRPEEQQYSVLGPRLPSHRQLHLSRGFSAECPSGQPPPNGPASKTRLDPMDFDHAHQQQHPPYHQACHPPGAPRPVGDPHSDPQQRVVGRPMASVLSSPPTRAQQRPAPPSYQQVVSMARYNQMQANHLGTRSPIELPIPPTRTVTVLPSTNHVSIRSASANPNMPLSQAAATNRSSNEPHKPRRHLSDFQRSGAATRHHR